MPRDIAARKIPIKNIYHMLSYAWDSLDIDKKIDLGSEDFENIYNLLAKIYIRGLNVIIKRGLYKDYLERQEELAVLRGKINIKDSINELSFLKNKMICNYDELTLDNELNSIVKATIALLMKNEQLNKNYKQNLKTYQFYFRNIKDIDLTRDRFNRIRYSRNNIHYKMLIDISRLIYEELLVIEKDGSIKFLDFIRDRKLAKLYEKFVLNFYKKKLFKNYKVHSPIINWDVISFSNQDEKYLPHMETDIVIEDKDKNIQIIIDTKFYSKTLSKESGKINSSNLYQIYSYVKNSNFNGEVRGMLLYPKIDEDIDVSYKISGKKISVKTVDLNDEWEKIEERLLSIVE